jgi:large subunit ribosomal protein L27
MIRNPFEKLFNSLTKRWATNLGGGSTSNGRDSPGKRLGIKMGNGSKCKVGQIIVRQRGFQYYPGDNVRIHPSFLLVNAVFRLVSVEIIRFGPKGMEWYSFLVTIGTKRRL